MAAVHAVRGFKSDSSKRARELNLRCVGLLCAIHPAARSRSVAKREKPSCSETFCRPRADRVFRMRRSCPAFHFKRPRARARASSRAPHAEIERHACRPTVWIAYDPRRMACRASRFHSARIAPIRYLRRRANRGPARRFRAMRRDAGTRCAPHATALPRTPTVARMRRPPTDPATPRSSSRRLRPDCWPTRHAQLEETP